MLRAHEAVDGAMRRSNRIDVMVGALGAVGLYIGVLWGLHRLADWLLADPGRWLIAAAVLLAWVCAWVVIGFVGSLLAALLR